MKRAGPVNGGCEACLSESRAGVRGPGRMACGWDDLPDEGGEGGAVMMWAGQG